jgi:hypothetical protein
MVRKQILCDLSFELVVYTQGPTEIQECPPTGRDVVLSATKKGWQAEGR